MGAPRIQAKVYEFLKKNVGQQFTPSAISQALGRSTDSSISWTLQSLCKKHPTTMRREPIGKTGRLATYGYRKANGGAGAAPEAPRGESSDVLITVPIGDNKSATLTAEAARKVYDQLRVLFGSGGK